MSQFPNSPEDVASNIFGVDRHGEVGGFDPQAVIEDVAMVLGFQMEGRGEWLVGQDMVITSAEADGDTLVISGDTGEDGWILRLTAEPQAGDFAE